MNGKVRDVKLYAEKAILVLRVVFTYVSYRDGNIEHKGVTLRVVLIYIVGSCFNNLLLVYSC